MTSEHFKAHIDDDIPGFNPLVPKSWGHEFWVANHRPYCGKILTVLPGMKSSWHYHDSKDETFHVIEGTLFVLLSDEDDIYEAEEIELREGDSLHVPPGTRHQFRAGDKLVNGRRRATRFVEFSTQHFEEDTHRLIKGD
jgi:mannose-6-phosphate isomerase-like protein (cupin superfamily)